MGHFDGDEPIGVVGEVGTTAPATKSTFIADEPIPFGSLVVIKTAGTSEDTKLIKLQTVVAEITLGVAIYQPNRPTGRYEIGDSVSVLMQGDIRVKVRSGMTFRAGDFVYIGQYIAPPDDTIEFTSENSFSYNNLIAGTFIDGGTATDANSFLINFRQCHRLPIV
jgi:hypothetical protein